MIAIAGGVGIVTVLPLLRIHPGRSKLYWGLRTQGLLGALIDDLKGVDKEVFVGQRMDVRTVLEKEIGVDRGKGAVVVVSGPTALADEVRAVLCELGKEGGAWPVKLVDESFG
jgi:NAD(P)H-flavin reductase